MAATERQKETLRQIWISSAILAAFAVAGSAMLSLTESGTRAQIEANQEAFLNRSLNDVMPPDHHDNDLLADTLQVPPHELLGSDEPVTVYRARKEGLPVAALFTVVARDGYGGDIRLLVGINYDGSLSGVRAVAHRETPGLGDAIEVDRSDWIRGFTGKSLGNPPAEKWRVKKDGGVFDQFTGATITPRAVVKAVKKALLYFKTHRDELFVKQTAEEANNG